VIKDSPMLIAGISGAIMGNHFHLVARMHPDDEISNSDVIKRWQDYYGDKVEIPADRMAEVKKRLCSLGAYAKDIKQNFTRLNAALNAA